MKHPAMQCYMCIYHSLHRPTCTSGRPSKMNTPKILSSKGSKDKVKRLDKSSSDTNHNEFKDVKRQLKDMADSVNGLGSFMKEKHT